MSKIDVTDEGVIQAPKKVVFDGMMSLMAGNESWWEPHLYVRSVGDKKPGSVGSTAQLHIPRRARFIARIDEVAAPSRLRVSYIDGDFRGMGLWTFESEGKATRIRFRWQSEPTRWWMRGFCGIVRRNHSRVMKIGFAALDRHLRGLKR